MFVFILFYRPNFVAGINFSVFNSAVS
jgi:hypothetical protein